MENKCKMCGLCCRLFYINLNEKEYLSGKYSFIFKDEEIQKFSTALKHGLNILAKKQDGTCVYIENNMCSIHQWRPKVCRQFFCQTKKPKHKKMIDIINEERHKLILK